MTGVGRYKSPTLFQRLPHNYNSYPGGKTLLARRRHYVGLLLSNALTVDVSTIVSCHPFIYIFLNLLKIKMVTNLLFFVFISLLLLLPFGFVLVFFFGLIYISIKYKFRVFNFTNHKHIV